MDASVAAIGLQVFASAASAVAVGFSVRAWMLARRAELKLKVHVVVLSAIRSEMEREREERAASAAAMNAHMDLIHQSFVATDVNREPPAAGMDLKRSADTLWNSSANLAWISPNRP